MNMNTITFEEFRNEINNAIEKRPVYIRPGQAAFNYVDENFRSVARISQHKYGIDCFYNDELIDKFIKKCYEILSNKEYLNNPFQKTFFLWTYKYTIFIFEII